jgi:DNA primase
VSKTSGSFICFNHSCGETGSLVSLVTRITKEGEFAARRIILQAKTSEESQIEKIRKIAQANMEELEFPQAKLDEMYSAFWENADAVQYMTEERGFEEDTLEYYRIGYSTTKELITVPMYDVKGKPLGIIGRPPSTTNKRFQNSKKLPVSKTLHNIHRAKAAGSQVIVVEASFDEMRVHQSGFPCVVACLGGYLSPHHIEQLNMYFESIVIMTDFDKKEKHMYENCKKCAKLGLNLCKGHNPGRDLGHTIAKELKNKRIYWASFESGLVYPNGAKDAGDMTDEEIRQCIENKVSNYDYNSWKLY